VFLFGGKLADIFSDLHGAEVRAAHGTEVRGLCAFLRQGLTNLMPIIFALAGFPVYVASS